MLHDIVVLLDSSCTTFSPSKKYAYLQLDAGSSSIRLKSRRIRHVLDLIDTEFTLGLDQEYCIVNDAYRLKALYNDYIYS